LFAFPPPGGLTVIGGERLRCFQLLLAPSARKRGEPDRGRDLRPPGRNVTVLVAENEYLLRMDTSSSLEAPGFVVHEAEDAAK